MLLQLNAFLDCVWNHEVACSKSGLQTLLQCSICYAVSESSLATLSMSHFYVLSEWSGSCHWFCVLLWELSRVAYQEVVATSLIECCSFFCVNYIWPFKRCQHYQHFSAWSGTKERWNCVWSTFLVGIKITRASFWRRSGAFFCSAWWFLCLILVFWCWLWTGSCLGPHSSFWFCSGQKLVQFRSLGAWSSAFTQLWLWTGFSHHICTFYYVWHAQLWVFYPA